MIRPLRYLIMLCLLWPWMIWADTLQLDTRSHSVAGFLERLDDPQGTLNAQAAMASSAWRTLPGTLKAGFTRDVVWLRLQVEAGQNAPAGWILKLNNALLDDVQLHVFRQDGSTLTLRSGEELDRAHWPVSYRAAAFPLEFEAGQPQVLLLRLQTKNAMSVSAHLMPATAFNQSARVEYLSYGLYFGIYLALIIFHSLFWRMTAAPESGWYLLFVSCCLLVESLSSGLVQQVTGMPVAISDRLLGCGLAAGLPIGFIFAKRQLRVVGFGVFPRLVKGACLLIALLAASAIMVGHYQIGAPLVQISSLLTIVILVSMAVVLLVRGHKPARFFLLVFGIYYAGVIVAFMRNLGLVPSSFVTDNPVAIGTILHMTLMSMRIIHHYRQLEEEKRLAQADFKQLLQNHNISLEQQIAERTLELREEIAQRTLLEGELREALLQEQHMREEQREFVAMVSHEFRTPLAIIGTSAQQIARNLSAPPERNEQRCQNIRDASTRLLSLVDDYLNHDRVEGTAAIARSAEHDLPLLLERIMGDLPAERFKASNLSALQTLRCDDGLLKIAIRNLLANADRHAPKDTRVQLILKDHQGFLDILVINEGPPIPEDQAALLFQKYFRGSQAQQHPGAGLGLHLVKRITELHGGEICLESRGEVEPIRFRLSLPASHCTSEQAAPPPRHAS